VIEVIKVMVVAQQYSIYATEGLRIESGTRDFP
jgi:hypothetical protein